MKLLYYTLLLLGLAYLIQISSSLNDVRTQRKIASILGEDDQNTLQTNRTVEGQANIKNIQWNNKADYPLSVQCNNNNGEALYRVRSFFIGWRRDRRWKWDCRKVADKPMTDCSWTGYINNLGGPINKKCSKNHVLTGLKSYHVNAREDRKWKMKCCKAPGYVTTNCKKSKRLNRYGSWLDYTTFRKGVFVGLHSLHQIRGRDREWQVFECKYTAKPKPTQPPPPSESHVKTRHFFFMPYDMLANLNPWGWGH